MARYGLTSALALAALMSPAVADARQSSDRTVPPGGQVSIADTTPTPTQQIPAEPSSPVAASQLAPALPAPADDGMPVATAEPVRQLSSGVQSTGATTQLSPADRSTQAASVSKPSEGRNVATPRIVGNDRCDPQSSRKSAPVCRQVIETRADSFARERPDLSPEQRLLAERYSREAGSDVMREVRRIGRNDVDPGSADTQALAAVMQARGTAEQAEAAEADASDDAQTQGAILDALITAIGVPK